MAIPVGVMNEAQKNSASEGCVINIHCAILFVVHPPCRPHGLQGLLSTATITWTSKPVAGYAEWQGGYLESRDPPPAHLQVLPQLFAQTIQHVALADNSVSGGKGPAGEATGQHHLLTTLHPSKHGSQSA